MNAFDTLNICLTPEERDILEGKQGAIRQKILQTIVLYGEALGAERLVDITGKGHMVITHAIPGICPPPEMLDDLIAAGLTAKHPFTLDPAAPLDYENWFLTPGQTATLERMYHQQARYDRKMLELGLQTPDACTCTPYLPQVGNRPRRGDILAWSESACVVFGNSVLGARSNRNGAIMDLLCNIMGKIPLSGFLTDEGRRATWRIEVQTDRRPLPQLLGAAIGTRVLADVPYIVGLDRFLDPELNPDTWDYLHELGTAAATAGAVGLFHAEGITPEALENGPDLLTADHRSFTITDADLTRLRQSYPVLWADPAAGPGKCYLGCPHLSLNQLEWWARKVPARLARQGGERVKVKTTICAAPQVLTEFRRNGDGWRKLVQAGVKFSPGCAMQMFDADLSKDDAVITNSNKLRAYTHARFFPDEEIVEILASAHIKGAA